MQAGRNCQGAKGRPDRLIPSFMKKGRLLPESSKKIKCGCDAAWRISLARRQCSITSTEQAAAESGTRGCPAPVPTSFSSCSYQLFGAFLQQEDSVVGVRGGKHLYTSMRPAPRPGRAPCSSVREHELCLSMCSATAWMWILRGWHKALGHSPGWLPRWDFMVVSAQLSLELQKVLSCGGPQGVLQTLWQRLFDDCCAELKIPQLWLGVQDN